MPAGVALVCVTKYQPVSAAWEAYNAGERDFAESRVQELLVKKDALPADVRWHFIGHLQTNKVRQLVPFVHLIQSVDSVRLLECISKEAVKAGRTVDVLLEMHLAQEETKTGFAESDLATMEALIGEPLPGVRIAGLMTMASHTTDAARIRADFSKAAEYFRRLFHGGGVLSMGMSDDYPIAVQEGSTMVRLGSCLFS